MTRARMRRAWRTAPLAAFLALVALGGKPSVSWHDPTPEWNALLEGPLDEVRLVVRDPELWNVVWDGFTRNQEPRIPPPPVDFGETMLLIAGCGERASGGYGIEFVSIDEGDREIVAVVRTTDPGPGAFVTLAVTHPVAIAAMPASDKPVRFVEDRSGAK
jgi:hypothetical protein